MTIDEQKKIFAENLSRYVERSGKQQKEISQELGISYTTFNTWMRGSSMPNAAKIQTLADYFGIFKSDLLDDASKAEMEERLTEYAVKIGAINKYLTEITEYQTNEIVAKIVRLNLDGLTELQKRLDEMLCVPKYVKSRDEVFEDYQIVSFGESGKVITELDGRIISTEPYEEN